VKLGNSFQRFSLSLAENSRSSGLALYSCKLYRDLPFQIRLNPYHVLTRGHNVNDEDVDSENDGHNRKEESLSILTHLHHHVVNIAWERSEVRILYRD